MLLLMIDLVFIQQKTFIVLIVLCCGTVDLGIVIVFKWTEDCEEFGVCAGDNSSCTEDCGSIK